MLIAGWDRCLDTYQRCNTRHYNKVSKLYALYFKIITYIFLVLKMTQAIYFMTLALHSNTGIYIFTNKCIICHHSILALIYRKAAKILPNKSPNMQGLGKVSSRGLSQATQSWLPSDTMVFLDSKSTLKSLFSFKRKVQNKVPPRLCMSGRRASLWLTDIRQQPTLLKQAFISS